MPAYTAFRPSQSGERDHVTGPPRLHPEDRADFTAVLHLALSTPDIRGALSADPTNKAAARLQATALQAADEITAVVADDYQEYIAVRRSARRGARRPAADGTLLPALLVLTPPVSATSAAVLLVLGYLLQLADVQGTLPGSLVTAGWVLALVAAVGTLVALAALLDTAIRRRGGPPHPDRLEQARLNWQQALLDRGMLPYLRQSIRKDPTDGASTHTLQTAPTGTAASDARTPKENHP